MARPKKSPTADTYVPLREAAATISYSVDTLREKIATGELPAYQLSGRRGAEIRVRLTDVFALLQPVIPPEIYAERLARQRHPLDRGPLRDH
jgi:excisionase family DNA binding protein